MYRLVTIILFAGIWLSCAITLPGIRYFPKHDSVDPELTPYVNEFIRLSKLKGITFSDEVGMGFADIDDGQVIGSCYLHPLWREVDIDSAYWARASAAQRSVLTLHELTHCYCGRNHDYDDGKAYAETLTLETEEFLHWVETGGPKPGRYYIDSCPTSLMFPSIIDSDCYLAHYSDYVSELFNRCKPF